MVLSVVSEWTQVSLGWTRSRSGVMGVPRANGEIWHTVHLRTFFEDIVGSQRIHTLEEPFKQNLTYLGELGRLKGLLY